MNGSILERIALAACPDPCGLVIEIGPGRGALTEKLLQRSARVVAIEIDHSLAGDLRRRFAAESRLEIIHADVLDVDLAQWGRAPIAGNLPYYITSPIIEKVLRLDFPRAVFLVQKEVAQRLAARPGTRDYGFLTVQTAAFADVKLLFDVKPGAFRPPPKVDSAVVRLEPRTPPLHLRDREGFIRFAALSFRHKRKTLRNNLVETYGSLALETWPEASLRAEQLTLDQLIALFHRATG